jgi:hypothetical protein
MGDPHASTRVAIFHSLALLPEIIAFRTLHPKPCANLDRDPNISDALRESLLDQWASLPIPPTGSKATDEFVKFCRNNKLAGPVDSVAQGASLGRVTDEDSITRNITSCGNPKAFAAPNPPSQASEQVHVGISVGAVSRQPPTVQKCVPLSMTPIMWAFYDPSDARSCSEPFCNIGKNAAVLRDRLGLGHLSGKSPLVLFSYRLPQKPRKVDPHVPTTFDAEIGPYFFPGGRTRPLVSAPLCGMPEVVHSTVTGASLSAPIERAA